MSNQKILTDEELNEVLAEARKDRAHWWSWYNSLNAGQIYSHYTRHHSIPIKQHYNEEVKQLPGVRQIIEETEQRIEDEA